MNGSLTKFSRTRTGLCPKFNPKAQNTHGSETPSYCQDHVVTTDLLTLGTRLEDPGCNQEVQETNPDKNQQRGGLSALRLADRPRVVDRSADRPPLWRTVFTERKSARVTNKEKSETQSNDLQKSRNFNHSFTTT